MKKILALLLAVLMLMSIAACSSEESSSDEVETAEVTSEITEETAEEKPEPAYPVEAKLVRGKTDGSKYSSEYTSLTFNAPEGWEYSTDEAMAALLNMGAEMLSEENIAYTLGNTTTVFDMIATDKNTGDSVTVSYENMKHICGKAVSDTEYMTILKERVGTQMQVDYEFKDEAEVTLCGEKYQRVVVAMSTDTFTMTQVYYIRVIEDVAVCITATYIGEKPASEIEAMFE